MKVILCQAQPISQNLIFYRKKGSDEQSDMQHCGPAYVSPIPSLSSVFGLVLHFSLCCQLCFTSTLKESLADVLIRIGICIGTWLCNLNVVLLTGNFVSNLECCITLKKSKEQCTIHGRNCSDQLVVQSLSVKKSSKFLITRSFKKVATCKATGL